MQSSTPQAALDTTYVAVPGLLFSLGGIMRGQEKGTLCYVCPTADINAAALQMHQAGDWIQTAVSCSVGWQCRQAP